MTQFDDVLEFMKRGQAAQRAVDEITEKPGAMERQYREALRHVLVGAVGSPRQLARRTGRGMDWAREIWQLAGLEEPGE